ncbi:MAG: hypothetical protein HY316_07660 [Acidobacteria bacterium]|nr:hypothetical protein [Acidobacteriota bacterium]
MKYKRQLSAYRDHSLPPEQYRSVWSHLYHCQECCEEVSEIEQLGGNLRRLPSPEIPKELAFQVRMRLSQERALRERPGWLWRLTNQWGHLALPGAAGLLSAVLIFAMFGSHFSVQLRAGAKDIPLYVRTSARPRDAILLDLQSRTEDMVVQLLIDQNGRVAAYDIVEGNYTPEELRRLRNSLLFAVFDPAMVFGVPTPDTLILSYRQVRVRG